jgi:predicted nuclease of predicted toxin-antitoxin system
MKLLFDGNLSFKLAELLSDLFPGSVHIRDVGLERADDRAIWAYAAENGLAIVSLDSDFAEMAAVFGSPPKVIWLRSGNQPTEVTADLLRTHFAIIRSFETDDVACIEIY